MDNFRNRLAQKILNFVIQHIADDEYEARIERYVEYGMRSYARDQLERRNPPPPMTVVQTDEWRRFAHLSDDEAVMGRWYDRRQV